MIFKTFQTCHDLIKGPLTILTQPVLIMESLWTINGDTDQPLLVVKKGAPGLIEQNTICLEEDRGYNPKKFLKFLYNWSPAALAPESYNK